MEKAGAQESAAPPSDFDRLYREQLGYVWRSLRRLGVPERDLEDVAHDTFVHVHRKLGDYDASRPIRPWLFGFAFRTALAYRRHSMQREVPSELRDQPSAEANPERLLATRERAYLLLQQLPIERRAVLIMHELDEMSAPEIAASLSIPLNTVYSRLRVARREFGEFAAREEET